LYRKKLTQKQQKEIKEENIILRDFRYPKEIRIKKQREGDIFVSVEDNVINIEINQGKSINTIEQKI